ncbi:MAG: TolC family protein [Oligoflexia bacterium]|nr:TolC family protein [Oligoflexia bacterium]
MMKLRAILTAATLAALQASPASAATLTVDQYLGQVANAHEGYQGAVASGHADSEASREATLAFSPQLFASLQHVDDRRQTIVPAFEGTRTVTDTSQFGFKKLFDFGLQTQLSYNISSNTIYNVSPLLVPQNSLVTSGLMLQLTQSLWQNGFGKMDRLTQSAVEAQDRANSFNNSYQAKTILADAESRYWVLAIAREVTKVQRASLERMNSIRDFNARRVRSHLADEADLLTSVAQAKAKEFDVKTAIDNERTSARAFNSTRGVDSDRVDETLALPPAMAMNSLSAPNRASMRDDVKAAEQSEIAASANSDAAAQKQLPTLNLVGAVSTNGLDTSLGTSVSNTLTTQYPYYSLAVNFSAPLDRQTVTSVRRAYAEQVKGAELAYHRRLFDQENDWKDLMNKFQEAKERLSIAVAAESAQKVKLENEVKRQKQGVTTTYQVFQYEIDYLNSELNRIQTQATIFGLMAQMKTYL